MKPPGVYTAASLRERQRLSFWAGVAVGAAVGVAAFVAADWLDARAPAAVALDAPRVVRQDLWTSVTAIPVRLGDHSVVCTLTIDRRHRAWSMAC